MFDIFGRKAKRDLKLAQDRAKFWHTAWENTQKSANRAYDTAFARRQALNEIVASVDSITTPNGTLRKVRRIASQAIDPQVITA